MADNVKIKETGIEEALEVQEEIVEFSEKKSKEYFEKRYAEKEKLIIVADIDGQSDGYSVWYDKFDSDTIYLWMAGVDPKYRRRGIFKSMSSYGSEWAKSRGYKKVRIKTRNNCREMLAFLVANGFNLINVISYPNIMDNRVEFIKEI